MITELPAAPDPAADAPATFSSKAAAFVLAQKTMVTQINAALAGFNRALIGTAYAFSYRFSTATADADPGPGYLRLNNATQNLATAIRLDLAGADTVDYTSLLDTFDASTSPTKGTIWLVKQGDITKWLSFDVTARATPAGYRNMTVVCTGGTAASPFAQDDDVLLCFQRNGDKGESNPVLHIREEKTAGLAAGSPALISSATSLTIYRRLLTIAKLNTIGGTLGVNTFPLPAGTYKVDLHAIHGGLGSGGSVAVTVTHKLALYCVTDAAYVLLGQTRYAEYNSSGAIVREDRDGMIKGTFTSVGGTKTYEVRQLVATNQDNYTMTINPAPSTTRNTGQMETYLDLVIEKIA